MGCGFTRLQSQMNGNVRNERIVGDTSDRGSDHRRQPDPGSALDHQTPAYDVQQACDTGLQAALAVAGKIALGHVEWGIAGGVDTTSDAPIAVNEGLRRGVAWGKPGQNRPPPP